MKFKFTQLIRKHNFCNVKLLQPKFHKMYTTFKMVHTVHTKKLVMQITKQKAFEVHLRNAGNFFTILVDQKAY